jgi:hypothetical protein
LGGKTEAFTISDVLKIQMKRNWQTVHSTSKDQSSSTTKRVLMAQSFIVLKDGKELPIDSRKSAPSVGVGQVSYSIGGNKELAATNNVAIFLGVPFEEVGAPEEAAGIIIR